MEGSTACAEISISSRPSLVARGLLGMTRLIEFSTQTVTAPPFRLRSNCGEKRPAPADPLLRAGQALRVGAAPS